METRWSLGDTPSATVEEPNASRSDPRGILHHVRSPSRNLLSPVLLPSGERTICDSVWSSHPPLHGSSFPLSPFVRSNSCLVEQLGIVFAAGASGGAVSYFGYYKPFLVFGPWLMCIGSGLLYTIKVDTSNSMLIGYQIILSLGVGAVLQNTLSTSSPASRFAIRADDKLPSFGSS